MKNDKWVIVGFSALFIAASFWVGKYFYKAEEEKKVVAQEASAFVRPHSPRLGTVGAKVVVVEFFDPECESCRLVYPDVKNLMKEYEGKIELVLRYTPFHRNSIFAIKILEAARRQDKFWETLTVLFDAQPEWGSHHDPQPEKIWDHLPKVSGLDIEKVRAALDNPETLTLIDIDKADGQQLNVTGTPTFFVNGQPLEDFGLEYLRAAIEREAAK